MCRFTYAQIKIMILAEIFKLKNSFSTNGWIESFTIRFFLCRTSLYLIKWQFPCSGQDVSEYGYMRTEEPETVEERKEHTGRNM